MSCDPAGTVCAATLPGRRPAPGCSLGLALSSLRAQEPCAPEAEARPPHLGVPKMRRLRRRGQKYLGSSPASILPAISLAEPQSSYLPNGGGRTPGSQGRPGEKSEMVPESPQSRGSCGKGLWRAGAVRRCPAVFCVRVGLRSSKDDPLPPTLKFHIINKGPADAPTRGAWPERAWAFSAAPCANTGQAPRPP